MHTSTTRTAICWLDRVDVESWLNTTHFYGVRSYTLVVEATTGIDDDNGISLCFLANTLGGTVTVNADTIVFGSTKEVYGDFRMSSVCDPVYNYEKNRRLYHYFGPMKEDCDDFGLAFHAGGLLMGSIDQDLVQVCNEYALL